MKVCDVVIVGDCREGVYVGASVVDLVVSMVGGGGWGHRAIHVAVVVLLSGFVVVEFVAVNVPYAVHKVGSYFPAVALLSLRRLRVGSLSSFGPVCGVVTEVVVCRCVVVEVCRCYTEQEVLFHAAVYFLLVVLVVVWRPGG